MGRGLRHMGLIALLLVLVGTSLLPQGAGAADQLRPLVTVRGQGNLRGLIRTLGVRTHDAVETASVASRRASLSLMSPFSYETLGSLDSRIRDFAAGGGTTRSAPSPLAPVSSGGFDAVANLPPVASPADPSGALGNSWYLTATNVRTSVYSSAGAEQFPPIRLRTLAPSLPASAFDFDPKVVYDHYADQFVLVFLALNKANNFDRSFIVIVTAPDATADDPLTWCVTKISGDQRPGDGRQWADYPAVGYNSDRVTISTNQFGFDNRYAYAQLISMPKADLYDCASGISGTVFGGKQTRNPDGTKAFTIQPAETYGAGPETRQFLLSFQSGRLGGRKLVLWRIASGGGLKLARTALNVGKARFPPFGTQQGGGLNLPNTWWDTGDLRLVNAVFDADTGLAYTAHAVARDIAPGDGYLEAATRWYEASPAGTLANSTVPRKGVFGTSERDAGWPVVATDGAGNLFVTYSQAGVPGAGEYLSAYVARVTPGGAVATQLLKAGEARYEAGAGPERWGDFNAINRNPTNASQVAIVNQYAIDDTGGVCGAPAGVTCLWQQWVDLVEDI